MRHKFAGYIIAQTPLCAYPHFTRHVFPVPGICYFSGQKNNAVFSQKMLYNASPMWYSIKIKLCSGPPRDRAILQTR